MQPTSSTVLQRPDLGAIAFEFLVDGAAAAGFIGLQVLPIFETVLKTAEYPVIPMEAFLKVKDTARAPRAGYNRDDYEFKTNPYFCKEHGWEEAVDDGEAAMYRRFFDAEELAVLRCMDVILRSQEDRIARMVFNPSNITKTDVAVPWSTADTADPKKDVNDGKKAMRLACGLVPNALVIAYTVFSNLMLTAKIKDAFKYTNPIELGGEEVQRRLLAQYFGVDRVLVAGAVKDTAKKAQDASISDIWNSAYAMLARLSNGGPDLREPSLGRTFLWTADTPEILTAEQYREEGKRSDIYRVRQHVDECFTFKKAAHLLGNITG